MLNTSHINILTALKIKNSDFLREKKWFFFKIILYKYIYFCAFDTLTIYVKPSIMTVVEKEHQQAILSIVLADDDRDDHTFFKTALAEIAPSTQLTIVENGDELLELLKNYIPDFIFLDLEMPCKNGLQCLHEIRGNNKINDIPIVIFSSTSRPANIDAAYEMGADLFFIKPSVYNELVSSIRAILALNWSEASKIKEQYFVNGRYVAFM